MNVVYTVSGDFHEKILPSMRSLIEHNPDAKIFVMTEGRELTVKTPCPVEVVDISGQKYFPKNGVNYNTPFSYVNLLKVAYGEILPLNRVIHLDADTIIVDSLKPVWETDLSGMWFGAVPEYRGKYYPFGPVYYNMGVAVLNLEQMRRDNIIPEMVAYLNLIKQPFADQDSFNKYAIEDDKARVLPIRYNENFATGETDDPAIVHYCGIRDWWTQRMHRREYLERYMK